MRAVEEILQETYAEKPEVGGVIKIGLLVILLVFVGGFLWAYFAPLSSAAIAPGIVSVEGKHKTIQHRYGGIVRDVQVKDGDIVRKGQLLLRLDQLELTAEEQLLANQFYAALALRARLHAEQRDQSLIFWPELLYQKKDDETIARIMEDQELLFKSRQESLEVQRRILNQQISQLRSRISAYEAQLDSVSEQYRIISEEVKDVETLFAKGLERRPRLLALQRERASMLGRQGELKGQIASVEESISEAEFELSGLKTTRLEEVASDLETVQIEIRDFQDRLSTLSTQIQRLDIVSPYDGVVLNLKYTNEGAVIPPNGEVLDIVPEGNEFVVLAKVKPTDIDLIEPNQAAKIQLTAFKMRNTPRIDGELIKISADTLQDELTGRSYYEAEIKLDQQQLSDLPNIILVPGMPVQVMLQGQERTAFEYLITPLTDSFGRAFTED